MRGPDSKKPNIDPVMLKDYTDTLIAKGPDDERWKNSPIYSKYKWVEYSEGAKDVGITVRYNDKRFGLLCNEPEFTMVANREWGLQRVYPEKDNRGRPAVKFEFDTKG